LVKNVLEAALYFTKPLFFNIYVAILKNMPNICANGLTMKFTPFHSFELLLMVVIILVT